MDTDDRVSGGVTVKGQAGGVNGGVGDIYISFNNKDENRHMIMFPLL